MAKKLTSAKAKKILHDKSVHGHPLTEKQRKFFGAIAGGATPQAQRGWLGKMERDVNRWLGDPMEKAYDAAQVNPNEDDLDNYRHPMAGRYTSEAIQKKTGNIPVLSPLAGFIGANVLGVGHELVTLAKDKRPMSVKLRESGEDAFNNMVGAAVGSFAPMTAEQKSKFLLDLSYKNRLPDGYGKGDMYFKKKNGGWLDKYSDIPQAQNGIEGTMGGLTDKGFNYNGAWGGTMQLGGSLPGAVGFMYARTQGAAPSNGPYAKKTKASAQDGRAVSDNTRLKPIVTEKLINREAVKSTNKSYKMSPEEALLNKLKGKKLKESQNRLDKTAEKLTAVGSLSPNPFVSIPSAIGNLTLGITGAPTPGDAGLDYMGVFGAAATPSSVKGFKNVARRVPFFKGINLADALSDVFEFTPSEDLPKKQDGGSMSYYQQGLDFKPKTISKKGSKIKKDDMGYWNPENWGEPVEIDSNEITMQGVYEPLIGISDTGDVQYMEPGEDYTFDGESVTEYPVTNWLDKYK